MQNSFYFQPCHISGLVIVQPFFTKDVRGFFSKTFSKSLFKQNGIMLDVCEEMESSSKRGTIRGLHFQYKHSQDKLVRVSTGSIYDVAVDLRKDSPTFGKWESVILSSDNQKMFYIPKGFAHGFLALQENTIVHYLCGDEYDPTSEGGILWNDPKLAIDWPLQDIDQFIVSERDANFPTLSEYTTKLDSLYTD